MKRYILILIIFFQIVLATGKEPGAICGKVYDVKSGNPLIGVNISLRGIDYGGVSDQNGFYQIRHLPVGSYILNYSMIGYEKLMKLNVEVRPGNQTILNVELKQSMLNMESVTVVAPAFQKSRGTVLSEMSIDLGALRADPGSFDVQRAMQTLPAVAGASDQINELIVRGGSPGENLFILDDIEIPSPNHFAMQGAGGGPINLINNEFISSVNFYAGAFPARYGDKASSVMHVKFREGSIESPQYSISMGMNGIGGSVEGPINKKGSYLFTGHKSYLDLIISNIGLTAIPQYWNSQGKIVYNLTNKHKIIYNMIYGNDAVTLSNQEEGGWGRGAEYVENTGYTYATGITLKSLWNKKSYSKLTAYQNQRNIQYDVDRYINDDARLDFFNKDDLETESALKLFYSKSVSPTMDFQFGGQIKNIKLDYYDKFWGDTLFGYIDDIIVDTVEINAPTFMDVTRKYMKSGAFFSMTFYPLYNVKVIPGIRLNHFSVNNEINLAPRLGISYILNEKTSLNVAYGRHYQTPFYYQLIENDGENEPELKSNYNDQFIFGIEHYPREDIKFTAEVYVKNIYDFPCTNDFMTVDTTDDFEYFDNGVQGKAQGLEFYFHKKLFDDWFAIISYSHSNVQFKDPKNNKWGPGNYDYRNVFNIVGSYRLKKEDGWNLFIKILALNSDEFTISLRYRHSGGRPYTKQEYNSYLHRWYTPKGSELNTERYPVYSRFDVNLQWRVEFKKMYLVSFCNIANILNRNNIWEYSYSGDGTIDEIYQYKTFPVGGFVLEF